MAGADGIRRKPTEAKYGAGAVGEWVGWVGLNQPTGGECLPGRAAATAKAPQKGLGGPPLLEPRSQ